MARQGDYIPIGGRVSSSLAVKGGRESRLVREEDEDENDLSDEGQDRETSGGTVNMDFRENIHRQRQATRESFLRCEEGSEEESARSNSDTECNIRRKEKTDEDENEEDRWETEQISRGVLLSQVGKLMLMLRFSFLLYSVQFSVFSLEKKNMKRKMKKYFWEFFFSNLFIFHNFKKKTYLLDELILNKCPSKGLNKKI